jgi:hypothetical protein
MSRHHRRYSKRELLGDLQDRETKKPLTLDVEVFSGFFVGRLVCRVSARRFTNHALYSEAYSRGAGRSSGFGLATALQYDPHTLKFRIIASLPARGILE